MDSEAKRRWRKADKERRRVHDREDRLLRKQQGICYSCNDPVERDATGKAKSYCPKHMELRRQQDRRRWHRMNGHLVQLPEGVSVVQEFLKEKQ